MAAIMHNNFTHLQHVMMDGIKRNLQDSLRDQFLEHAKPIIDEAVERAMESFKASVESYVKMENMDYVVKVLLEDKRT